MYVCLCIVSTCFWIFWLFGPQSHMWRASFLLLRWVPCSNVQQRYSTVCGDVLSAFRYTSLSATIHDLLVLSDTLNAMFKKDFVVFAHLFIATSPVWLWVPWRWDRRISCILLSWPSDQRWGLEATRHLQKVTSSWGTWTLWFTSYPWGFLCSLSFHYFCPPF